MAYLVQEIGFSSVEQSAFEAGANLTCNECGDQSELVLRYELSVSNELGKGGHSCKKCSDKLIKKLAQTTRHNAGLAQRWGRQRYDEDDVRLEYLALKDHERYASQSISQFDYRELEVRPLSPAFITIRAGDNCERCEKNPPLFICQLSSQGSYQYGSCCEACVDQLLNFVLEATEKAMKAYYREDEQEEEI